MDAAARLRRIGGTGTVGWPIPLAVASAFVLATPFASGAQENGTPAESAWDSLAAAVPEDPDAAPVPFGPGEQLVYKVKVGIFNAGEGEIRIEDTETVRGRPTYRAVMAIDGGLPGLRVNDAYTSWFDIRNLVTWRYIRDIDEPYYESYRHYEMFPERRTWERQDNDEFGTLGSLLPLDEVSFIYFIRTLPLEVGKTYTFNRYFKEDGNPVKIRVLRRDERETEGVRYKTIVVKPVIKTDGLFGEGGDAELHFTDDDNRYLVYLKSNIPKFPGSLTLHLREARPGMPLNPGARAEAMERREAEADSARAGR